MNSRTLPAAPSRTTLTKLTAAFLLSGAMIFATATASSAQVVKRAVQGGLLGAGIGAIAGGGKGAGRGAAIGAAAGAIVGAAEKSNARTAPPPRYTAAPPPPRPVYNDPLVYNIQTSLTRLGYNPGPVDGVYGQRTADAIRAYEYNNQLPLTGQPSPNLYNHMVSHGG